MSREYPLERIVEEARHRLGLLRPRIPGDAPRRAERAVVLSPEVVAREEELLLVEERHAPARVTRQGNRDEIAREADVGLSFEDALDAEASRAVIRVHDALAPEARGVLGVVGHVVLVGEEHETDAAELPDAIHERRGRARRVDEDIARVISDEVARRPVGLLGGVAAEEDAVLE